MSVRLTIHQIKEAHRLCKLQCKTIATWRQYWQNFKMEHNLTDNAIFKISRMSFNKKLKQR